MSLKRILAVSLLSLLPVMGCAKSRHSSKLEKEPLCSYEAVKETSLQRHVRLGDTPKVCAEVVPGHNNVKKKRINMLFVGINYTEDEFAQIARDGVDCRNVNGGILSVEPFKSNLNAFNFWYVKNTAKVEDEDYKEGKKHNGDEADDSIKKLARMCNFPRKATIGMVNWNFRSESGLPMMTYINLNELDLENIGAMQNNLKGKTKWDCRESTIMCKHLDFDDNGVVDNEDKHILKKGSLSEQALEKICDYYVDVSCLDAVEKGKDTVVNNYVATFRQAEKKINGLGFCSAMSKLKGRIDPDNDSYLCEILANNGNMRFATLKVEDSDFDDLPHELGHCLFGLHDEYVEPDKVEGEEPVETEKAKDADPDHAGEEESDKIKKEYYADNLMGSGYNCYIAETKEECVSDAFWSGMIGEHKDVGCYKGCYYLEEFEGKTVWRSTKKDIMEDMKGSYGAWNELRACNVIHVATQNASGICLEYLNFLKE